MNDIALVIIICVLLILSWPVWITALYLLCVTIIGLLIAAIGCVAVAIIGAAVAIMNIWQKLTRGAA